MIRRRRVDLWPCAFIAPLGGLRLAISFHPSVHAVGLALADASWPTGR